MNDVDPTPSPERQGPLLDGTGIPDAPKWRKRLLPAIFLLAGILAVVVAVKLRKPPKRRTLVTKGVLVETVPARAVRERARITGNGVVQPRRQVALAPQVGGPVVWVSPKLDVGAYVPAGTVLVRIDEADYALALERARAAVATATQALAQAEAASRVAREEWRRAGHKGEPSPLVAKLPQLAAARAGLASAKAGVRQARLNLARTRVRAPFAMRIRQKQVDVGQYVRPGQTLLTGYGTDEAQVVVSLPTADASWLEIPRPGRPAPNPPPAVTVTLDTGRGRHTRPGRLVRSVGEVDPTGRMTRVLVAVDDPFNLRRGAAADAPDLDIGSFVEVSITGRPLAGTVAIPEAGLRVGSVVWVAKPNDTLEVRKVVVARRLPDVVYVARGLAPGEPVIVSHVAGAMNGMKIRRRRPAETPAAPAPGPKEARRERGRAPAATGAKAPRGESGRP